MQRRILFGIALLIVSAVLILYDAAILLAKHIEGSSAAVDAEAATHHRHHHLQQQQNSDRVVEGSSFHRKSTRNSAIIRNAQVKELNSVHPHHSNGGAVPFAESSSSAAAAGVGGGGGGGDQSHHEEARENNHQLPPYHNNAGTGTTTTESVDEYLLRRSFNGRILIVPVNMGYLEFGLNLLCSLLETKSTLLDGTISASKGYAFVAMDASVDDKLRKMNLPVFRDPDMPFVSSQSAAWADPKFHKLVCTKLFPVLRALRLGLSVVLSDADIVFRRDPAPYINARQSSKKKKRHALDIMFSIGSCHRDLPDNYDLAGGDGIAKLNTGFYSVSLQGDGGGGPGKKVSATGSDAAVIDLFERALQRCSQSSKLRELEGDQPAMNAELNRNSAVFQQQHNQHQSSGALHHGPVRPRYGFFDGCLFANGCVFFKHLCANLTSLDPSSDEAIEILSRGGNLRSVKASASQENSGGAMTAPYKFRRDDPVMVHANFLVGKKDKIKHLRKSGLWKEQCLNRFLN